jgi:hypothetical protein
MAESLSLGQTVLRLGKLARATGRKYPKDVARRKMHVTRGSRVSFRLATGLGTLRSPRRIGAAQSAVWLVPGPADPLARGADRIVRYLLPSSVCFQAGYSSLHGLMESQDVMSSQKKGQVILSTA